MKILAAVVGLLAVLVGMVYWRTYFLTHEKARRPLAELRQDALLGATPEVRVRAAIGITEYAGDPEANDRAVATLREVADQSKDAAVKAAVMDGLRQAKDWDSLPTILNFMNDENEELRARAGVAAEDLVGAKYDFHANDPPKKRQAIIAEMRKYYENSNAARIKRKSEGQP